MDKPDIVQYLYWLVGNDWTKTDLNGDGVAETPGVRKGVLRGDWGISLVNRKPVTEVIGERLPNTLILMVTAEVLILIVALAAFFIFAWDKATGLSADERREITLLLLYASDALRTACRYRPIHLRALSDTGSHHSRPGKPLRKNPRRSGLEFQPASRPPKPPMAGDSALMGRPGDMIASRPPRPGNKRGGASAGCARLSSLSGHTWCENNPETNQEVPLRRIANGSDR